MQCDIGMQHDSSMMSAILMTGEFGKSFHMIYPPDLHLKCEHNGIHATFLDLDISIVDGLFIYKLYDKRDESRLPYLPNHSYDRQKW